MKPKALILSGYGLNCEDETKYAFELAGANGQIIHINDLIKNKSLLNNFQIMAIPGGFAYGDDTGSGNAYGLKLRNHLWDQISDFVSKDRLVLGICNGFQILVNLGLVPALHNMYGQRQVALLPNDSHRYTTGWFDLAITSDSPWLTGITKICLPIAHGEGKFYASKDVLKKMHQKNIIAAIYVKNPTGTLENIAAITNENKKILGIMPHPERAMFFTQLPDWPYQKELYQRQGKQVPTHGPGLRIFQNAVRYFQ